MKQFFKYLLATFAIVSTLSACNKAVQDEFVSYNDNALNDTVWNNSGYNANSLNKIIIPDATRSTTIVDSFDCLSECKLTFGDSIQIIFPANSYTDANGNPITNNTSKIKAEIILLNQKGDFVKYATPTTNIFTLLEASNFCDIKLIKDSKEVNLAPNSQVKVRIKDSTANNNMKFFTGNSVKYFKDSVFAWTPSSDGKVALWLDNSNGGGGKTLGYEFTTSRIRWFGAATFADSSAAKTKLNVILPPNFTNKNTVVFAVLKNSKTIISLLSNPENKTFFTYNIPVNTEFTLISVSKIDGNYYFDSRVIKNANANPVSLSPYKKTLAFILELIGKL